MYRAPVKDLRFVLDELLGSEALRACPEFSEYTSETADAVCARFAGQGFGARRHAAGRCG
jgi:hypothetical protein